MKHYPIRSYGLYVTTEDVTEYAEENEMDENEALEGIGVYISDADGECIPMMNGKSFDVENASFYMIELEKFPELFEQAYANEAEALMELMDKASEYLNDGFDFAGKFVEFTGTTYG
jgi:hypothetical protein